MNLKFNLKDKTHQTLLYACCYYQKKRIKVSTGIKVYSDTWDAGMQRCIVSNQFPDRMNREARKVNKFLDSIDVEWKEYIDSNNPYTKYGYYSSPEYVKYTIGYIIGRIHKNEKEQQEKEHVTPLRFFENYIDNMTHNVDSRTGKYIGERTQVHHRTVYKRIKSFMSEKHLKDDFSIFDERFAKLFADWAYVSKHYRYNTIPATFSVLKVWLNAARKEKLLDNETYKSYTSKGTEVDNIYLTCEDIAKIYALDINALKAKGEIDSKSTIEITRDLFLVGCWTGLRRSDINRLDKALFDVDKGIIRVVTEKTSEIVEIPMHPMVRAMWEKYEGKFPHLADKGKVNHHLQELGRHAQINENVIIKENRGGKVSSCIYKKYQLIKFHTARRSFATNLYLAGAPTISIMKLTGHTTEMNFLKYIKISKEENAEFMRKYFT